MNREELTSLFGQSQYTFEQLLALYQRISPGLLVVGIFFFILSFMFSLTNPTKFKPKIVGTYNPKFDPNYRKKGKSGNHYQYISLGLIILGAIPWILTILLTTKTNP